MRNVLKRIEAEGGDRIKTAINPGEGAFYGPKFEYVLRDAIGRDWQCGTTQVDFNLPERFDAFYIAADGSKKTPVMIHRAICGSMERFLGVVLEHYAGHLPLWLAPKQAMVCTITQDADDYAAEVTAAARKAGLRVDADLKNEKINYKVREHSLAKVPALLVVGKKEAETRQVSIRRLGSEKQSVMPLDEALKMLADEALPPDLKRAGRRSSSCAAATSGTGFNHDERAGEEVFHRADQRRQRRHLRRIAMANEKAGGFGVALHRTHMDARHVETPRQSGNCDRTHVLGHKRRVIRTGQQGADHQRQPGIAVDHLLQFRRRIDHPIPGEKHVPHGQDQTAIEDVYCHSRMRSAKLCVAAQKVQRRKQLPVPFAMQRDQLSGRDIAADAAVAVLGPFQIAGGPHHQQHALGAPAAAQAAPDADVAKAGRRQPEFGMPGRKLKCRNMMIKAMPKRPRSFSTRLASQRRW